MRSVNTVSYNLSWNTSALPKNARTLFVSGGGIVEQKLCQWNRSASLSQTHLIVPVWPGCCVMKFLLWRSVFDLGVYKAQRCSIRAQELGGGGCFLTAKHQRKTSQSFLSLTPDTLTKGQSL